MQDIIIVLIPSIVASMGFVIRFFWERHTKMKYQMEFDEENQRRNKLEKFYYPLYFNLEKLSSLWQLKDQIDINEECIKIHNENQDIIKTNIVKANPVPKLVHEIMRYNKHVTIYKAIYKNKDVCTPRQYNAEYPDEFKDTIKKRIDYIENVL